MKQLLCNRIATNRPSFGVSVRNLLILRSVWLLMAAICLTPSARLWAQPSLVSSTPPDGAINIDPLVSTVFTLSAPANPAATYIYFFSSAGFVNTTPTWSANNTVVTSVPDSPGFPENDEIDWYVFGQDTFGQNFDYQGTFRTGVAKPEPSWRPLGPFGGDIVDVNVSPSNPNIMLAGAAPQLAVGALFRSADAGASWARVPTFGNQNAYQIDFGGDGKVWVASDDSVRVSTDAGQTFSRVDMGLGSYVYTYAVKVDPSNPQIIWAGTTGPAVMKSVNGGASWAAVTPSGVSVPCTSIAINPANSLEAMVTFGNAFSAAGAVRFTSDGGQTWVDAGVGLPPRPANAVVCDHGRWFLAAGQLFGGQYSGLWESVNGGKNWTRLDSGWPSAAANSVAIDPLNQNVILAATPNGVHKSINGGQTWTVSAASSAQWSVNSVRFAPGSSSHVMMGVASLGAILSDDALATTRISSTGINSLNVYSVSANPKNPNELAAAFQSANSGGVFSSTNGGQTWRVESAPPTRYSYVKFNANGVLYAASTGPYDIAQDGLYRREFNGSWTPLGPAQDFDSFDFGSANANLIIGSAGGGIWRTPNGGVSWTERLQGGAGDASIQRVFILPDGTDQTVLAAAQTFSSGSNGGVYRSTDGGQSWGQVTDPGLPSNMWAFDFASAPHDPHTVYAVNGPFSGGGVFRSVNGGANWTTYANGYNARGVAVSPASADDVYFWTIFQNNTVYHASQNGARIVPADGGIQGGPQQIISAPGLYPRLLMAANTGVYELALGDPPQTLGINPLRNSVVLTWTNSSFSLQAAPNFTGPFTNVAGATSPYTNTISSSKLFFRLAK